MRKLTLTGFLAAYVKELADAKTLNIHKLYDMLDENSRLKEPFYLYCLYSSKSDVLLKYLSSEEKEEYSDVMNCINNNDLSALPINYQKVFEAYKFRSERYNNETRIKALMADKIVKMQKQKKITKYRIYTDLHINAGNFNDFIKNRKYNKLSLDKSREVMNYLESIR